MRNDGLFYGVSDENGKFYVNLYNKDGVEVDGFSSPFTSEDDAFNAALIAERAFAEGQKDVFERQ